MTGETKALLEERPPRLRMRWTWWGTGEGRRCSFGNAGRSLHSVFRSSGRRSKALVQENRDRTILHSGREYVKGGWPAPRGSVVPPGLTSCLGTLHSCRWENSLMGLWSGRRAWGPSSG